MARPDLILEVTPNKTKAQRIIVDTKQKLMENNEPSDDDLKQMFLYAHYFESSSLILLYPSVDKDQREDLQENIFFKSCQRL
jgi:5-methylcytosine-specific restriction enzyme subunit McrC